MKIDINDSNPGYYDLKSTIAGIPNYLRPIPK